MSHANLSRRAILAGAAAGPALAFPAGVIPPEPDPILTAIEEHRRAWAELGLTKRRPKNSIGSTPL